MAIRLPAPYAKLIFASSHFEWSVFLLPHCTKLRAPGARGGSGPLNIAWSLLGLDVRKLLVAPTLPSHDIDGDAQFGMELAADIIEPLKAYAQGLGPEDEFMESDFLHAQRCCLIMQRLHDQMDPSPF